MYDYYWYQIADLDWFKKKMLVKVIEGTMNKYVPERFVFDIDYAKQFGFIWEPKFDAPWGQMCGFNSAKGSIPNLTLPRSGRILGSEENRSNIPKMGVSSTYFN